MTIRFGKAQWARLGLFATAFTTGAVVMALEILGSRLLASVFGNSLYVWGATPGALLHGQGRRIYAVCGLLPEPCRAWGGKGG